MRRFVLQSLLILLLCVIFPQITSAANERCCIKDDQNAPSRIACRVKPANQECTSGERDIVCATFYVSHVTNPCTVAVNESRFSQNNLDTTQSDVERATIQPRLQIPIGPNFQFSKILTKTEEIAEQNVTYAYIPYLADYFSMVYKYLIGAAGVLAGIMITIGGFQWLIARGDGGKITQAQSRIKNALLGLVLALGSYTILYLVNPDLVTFKNLRIKLVDEEPLTTDDSPEEIEEGPVALDQSVSFSRGYGCNKAGIQTSAEGLVNVPTCIGPNHCVWFVNRALSIAGCSVNHSNVAHGPTLKQALLRTGWQQHGGNLRENLDKMKNVAVIRRKAHYALVIRTGNGNSPSNFICYESNYTELAQKIMRQYGGPNCTINSRGRECEACEKFKFEGPSPDTSGGYWAKKYTRRYGNNSKNQAFIKWKGLCGTSDEFFVLSE